MFTEIQTNEMETQMINNLKRKSLKNIDLIKVTKFIAIPLSD